MMATSERFDETQPAASEGKADKPDRYGEWLADDARIWRVYGQLAKEDDKEKAQRWNGGLNNLALFAALFSGITTAFIIESQNDLKPDFAELAYRVQNATAHGLVYVEEPFVVPGQARLVNCLWITSLMLSLCAALIAIMGQDWVEMYIDRPVCNPRQWAEIRSFRLNGVYRWCMPGVIATAPVLLHLSLFLFGTGLSVFMNSDFITQNLCIALCATLALLYFVAMFSPILWSSSPFRSPATMLVRQWFYVTFRLDDGRSGSLAENTARGNPLAHRCATAPGRVQRCFLRSRSALNRILHCYGLKISGGWTDNWRRLFCGTFKCDGDVIGALSDDAAGGNDLPACEAAHDSGMPMPASESQPRTRGSAKNCLLRCWTVFNCFLAHCGPTSSNDWMARFRRRFYPPLLRNGNDDGPLANAARGDPLPHGVATHDAESLSALQPAAPGWLKKYLSRSQKALNPALDLYGPDAISTGWTNCSDKPTISLVADSLSWISSASSAPEVAQLIAVGLCDHVTGLSIGRHDNAQGLIQKLLRYAEGNWERMGLLELSRYVIISGNAGLRTWPHTVVRRFTDVIYSQESMETPISQDFLIALVYLTEGFSEQHLSHMMRMRWKVYTATFIDFPVQLERLCGRIPLRSPSTLITITAVIARVTSTRFAESPSTAGSMIALLSSWRDVLPRDLGLVRRVLQGMLTKEAVKRANVLTSSCPQTCNRNVQPIDAIIHSLVAFLVSLDGEAKTGAELQPSALDVLLFLVRTATKDRYPHTCLAAIFGSSDPEITSTAWRDRPLRDMSIVMERIFLPPRGSTGYRDFQRPALSRTIARCICPPFPFPEEAALIGPVTSWDWGRLMFDWVAERSMRIGATLDLFCPTLEQRGLVDIFCTLGELRDLFGRWRLGPQLWLFLGAIAMWIAAQSDAEYRLRLFKQFVASHPACGSEGAAWDLVGAIGVIFASARYPRNFLFSEFLGSARDFLSALKKLRAVSPESRLWMDVAREFKKNRDIFPADEWPGWSNAVLDAIGVDPKHIPDGQPPQDVDDTPPETAHDAESVTNGRLSTAELADTAGDTPFLNQSARQLLLMAAGATL